MFRTDFKMGRAGEAGMKPQGFRGSQVFAKVRKFSPRFAGFEWGTNGVPMGYQWATRAKYVLENGERVFENGEHMLESGERLLLGA